LARYARSASLSARGVVYDKRERHCCSCVASVAIAVNIFEIYTYGLLIYILGLVHIYVLGFGTIVFSSNCV